MNYNLLATFCLDEINKKTKPIHPKYNTQIKFSNLYYLTMMFFMLNDVNNWKFLSKLYNCKSKYKYHYKTIYNKFRKWTSLDIFKNAFYNYKSNKQTNLLLIDATSISNKLGSENVVINSEYKKKKLQNYQLSLM